MVKICGLKSVEEAMWVSEAGAELAGIVLFYPKSKRNMDVAEAERIIRNVKAAGDLKFVAVMVAPYLEQVMAAEAAGFDYVQIHGQIDEEILENAKLPILKAFNVKDISEYPLYEKCDKIAGFVFDANIPGSGKGFDYKMLEEAGITPFQKEGKIYLLAGGLEPGNVAEALKMTGFTGADTSSGVEREDGNGKDKDKIFAFVKAANNSI